MRIGRQNQNSHWGGCRDDKNLFNYVHLLLNHYISFVKAMDTFRGMKLLFIEDSKSAFTANIRVAYLICYLFKMNYF